MINRENRDSAFGPDLEVAALSPSRRFEIVDKYGEPTFQEIVIPPQGDLIADVRLQKLTEEFRLPEKMHAMAQHLIDQRKYDLHWQHVGKLIDWEANGAKGDAPAETIFKNGHIVRVHPEKIELQKNKDQLILNLGIQDTKYFDYVATRQLDPNLYDDSIRAMPLALCGVLITKDKQGQQFLIYTVRSTKNEVYAGFNHVVGGMIQASENPKSAWLREVKEESGIPVENVNFKGCLGLIKDTYFVHPEATFLGELDGHLEDYFVRKKNDVLEPLKKTDKEVEFRVIPWDKDIIKSFLTYQQDSHYESGHWVPTGILNVMLAGRYFFGQDWYQNTVNLYREAIVKL